MSLMFARRRQNVMKKRRLAAQQEAEKNKNAQGVSDKLSSSQQVTQPVHEQSLQEDEAREQRVASHGPSKAHGQKKKHAEAR